MLRNGKEERDIKAYFQFKIRTELGEYHKTKYTSQTT